MEQSSEIHNNNSKPIKMQYTNLCTVPINVRHRYNTYLTEDNSEVDVFKQK